MSQSFFLAKDYANRCTGPDRSDGVVVDFDEETVATTTRPSLSRVETMKRRELLELYLLSSSPSSSTLSSVEITADDEGTPESSSSTLLLGEKLIGDWDGTLLDNNGWLMTFVSSFLTNRLFGRNRSWIGKSFEDHHHDSTTTAATTTTSVGRNRFVVPRDDDDQDVVVKRHSFDYEIASSALDARPCLRLTYAPYQKLSSPWKTMVDELRIVEVFDDETKSTTPILLGMGSMAWSGGVWNAAPFLLRKTTKAS